MSEVQGEIRVERFTINISTSEVDRALDGLPPFAQDLSEEGLQFQQNRFRIFVEEILNGRDYPRDILPDLESFWIQFGTWSEVPPHRLRLRPGRGIFYRSFKIGDFAPAPALGQGAADDTVEGFDPVNNRAMPPGMCEDDFDPPESLHDGG